jgi:hypothetical protein
MIDHITPAQIECLISLEKALGCRLTPNTAMAISYGLHSHHVQPSDDLRMVLDWKIEQDEDIRSAPVRHWPGKRT